MKVFAVVLLIAAGLATPALAADVPLPLKKPKDAKGQPLTKAGQPAAANTPSAGATPGVWPKTIDEAKEEADAKAKPAPIPTEWPAEEVAAAQAMCKTILEKIDAVTIAEPAFRQGDCGAPAPVRLITIGKEPEVALSPPPVLTCGMVGALHTWLTKDLQPLARRSLGADVIKIESMSDYSCRNAYGRTKTKLSEHGRANALDIRSFVTSKGEMAVVLTGWGETKRDIAAREDALKKAAEKAAAEAARIARPAVAPTTAPATAASEATGVVVRKTIADGVTLPAEKPAFGVAPQHLGGPEATAEPPRRVQAFLKGAHTAACQIFGTTLGPEANNAHRNHFHVDMAPRKVKKICD
ncbi:MAG: extensin family protein [Hyphomicrobium sp.]|mgnify:CR=1 FL=1|nr:extensin family protein [Hyphomicrobium sp.]